MRKILVLLLLAFGMNVSAQSRSVTCTEVDGGEFTVTFYKNDKGKYTIQKTTFDLTLQETTLANHIMNTAPEPITFTDTAQYEDQVYYEHVVYYNLILEDGDEIALFVITTEPNGDVYYHQEVLMYLKD